MRCSTLALMAAVLAAAMQACVGASTPAESTGGLSHERAVTTSCPVVADACGAGCFPAQLQPVDVAGGCLLPLRTVGCSPFNVVGPPALACSVTADGTVWISKEFRRHPAGRACSDEEFRQFLDLPACSSAR